MTDWQPIETAPKRDSNSPEVDLWAKCWVARDDKFVFRRFPDCSWSGTRWMGLSPEWRATHWRQLPEPPK
jgi:hypothetical protein